MNNVLPFGRRLARALVESKAAPEPGKPAFIPPDDTQVWVCSACRGYLFFIRHDGHQCSTCGRFQVYD